MKLIPIILALAAANCLMLPNPVFAWQTAKGQRLEVKTPFLAIKDQALIPALERGALARLDVSAGSMVNSGQVLGSLDDQEAKLAHEAAVLDLRIAEAKAKGNRSVETAQAALDEARCLLQQAIDEAAISTKAAGDESGIQLARKEEELAKGVLDRERISKELSRLSVSDETWDKVQNEFAKRQIATQRATLEHELASLRAKSKAATVSQQQAAVSRLENALSEAKSLRELEKLELQSLEKAVALTESRLEKRRIKAPFDGMVVEEKKHQGEWAEPGEAILRIVRLSRLHAEGFVDAEDADGLKPGQAATLITTDRVTKEAVGQLVFISPEVDSNRQVLIRVEIPNPDLTLKPGLRVQLWVNLSDDPLPSQSK